MKARVAIEHLNQWRREIQQPNFLPHSELRNTLRRLLLRTADPDRRNAWPFLKQAITSLQKAADDSSLDSKQQAAVRSGLASLTGPGYSVPMREVSALPDTCLAPIVVGTFARMNEEHFEDDESALATFNSVRGRFVPPLDSLFGVYYAFAGRTIGEWIGWLEEEGDDPVWVPYQGVMITWQLASVASWAGTRALLRFLADELARNEAHRQFVALTFAELVIRAGRHEGGRLRVFGGGSAAPDIPVREQSVRPPSSEEAYVNLSFEDEDDHQPLDANSGLTVGHVYRLQVGLGTEIDPLQQGMSGPLQKEASAAVSMRVAVLSRMPGIRFINHLGFLDWGPGSHMKPAEFVLEALVPGRVLFDVYIDRDCDLLFAAAVEAEVALPGAVEWSTPSPIGWRNVTSASAKRRSRAFRRFAHLQQVSSAARSICIAIQKADVPDEYLMTVLPAGKDVELPMRAQFSRMELDGLLSIARGTFDRLRRNAVMLDGGYDREGQYTGCYEPTEACHRLNGGRVPRELILDACDGFIRHMAISGAALRSRLFDKGAQDIHALICSTAKDGSVLQILTEESATEFLLPWNWLYDEPYDAAYRTPPKLECFWGMRLVVEQICDCLEPPLRGREDPRLSTERGVTICAGVYNFAQLPAHRQFLLSLATEGRATPRIEVRILKQDREWEAFLPKCDVDILYFFSHGHTAKPVGAAGTGIHDMAEALRSWIIATAAPDETKEMADARKRIANALAELEAGGLAEQHHIRLETGNLMLEDLRKLNAIDGHAPLVILNMCESAQVFPSLGDGLVRVFLERGAVGVVGTEMPMLPQFAVVFGRRLLTELLRGEPIGKTLLALRQEFMHLNNPILTLATHGPSSFHQC
jgi:hypothetical protein